MVKNLPAMWETWVQSLGWEDPLEEGMAILAWRIPMDRGAWQATGHEVTKSQTQLCNQAQYILKKKKKKTLQMALLLIQILTFSEQNPKRKGYCCISSQNCIYITSVLSKNKSGIFLESII